MLPEDCWWQASQNDSAAEVARALRSVAASVHQTSSDCLLFAELVDEDITSELAGVAEGLTEVRDQLMKIAAKLEAGGEPGR